MKNKFQTDTYAVMGNPISHSKSPFIHTEFAKQTQQQLQYIAIEVPLDKFRETVLDFQERGGKGLSITVPFKIEAFELVNPCSERAKLAKAVNTIILKQDGTLMGDNTDGIGLITDLTKNQNFSFAEKNILIIGAGGAVRGIIAPILEQKPASILIANRTANKAQELAQQFHNYGPITGGGLEQLTTKNFDLIINGTSASLSAELPPLPANIVKNTTICYDMAYGAKPTVFMQWAENDGAKKCFDGLGMLVEQAAEQFYLWRGIKPETQAIIKKLRSVISN